jgi:hypothetical protein
MLTGGYVRRQLNCEYTVRCDGGFRLYPVHGFPLYNLGGAAAG